MKEKNFLFPPVHSFNEPFLNLSGQIQYICKSYLLGHLTDLNAARLGYSSFSGELCVFLSMTIQ